MSPEGEEPPGETGIETETVTDLFAGTPYANSLTGWWTEHGGALDVKSRVVFIPRRCKPQPETPIIHRPSRRRGWRAFRAD